MFFVPNRKRRTLLPLIYDNIAAASVIHSDGWAAYVDNIEYIPNRNYTHLVVNHTHNFVDPITGAWDVIQINICYILSSTTE